MPWRTKAQSARSHHPVATASRSHPAEARAHMRRPTLHNLENLRRPEVIRATRVSRLFAHCHQTGMDAPRRPMSLPEMPTCHLSRRRAYVVSIVSTTPWQKGQCRHRTGSTFEAPQRARLHQSVPRTRSTETMAQHPHKHCIAVDLRIHSFVWI